MARQLIIQLVGDSTRFTKSLDEAESKLQRTTGKMKSLGNKLTVGVTLPLVALGKSAFDAASDVNENMSKVETIFGQNAATIDRWARGAASSIGLARVEALGAAGSFGNMFTQLGIGTGEAAKMSTSIVGLAADFASFHNADITSVIEAQSAAFRGEYDSLQKFLPLINAATVEQKALEMTGKASNKELTAQEKALAVNALMFEGAGKALGDFNRTSDSAANTQRTLKAEFANLQAELGGKLLPVGEKLLGWLRSAVEWLDKVGVGSANAGAALIGLALAGPVIRGVAAAIDVMTVAVRAANAALSASPLLTIAGVFTGIYVASEKLTGGFDGISRGITDLKGHWKDLTRTVGDFIDMVKKIPSKIPGVGFIGDVVGGIANFKLPGFATGGVVGGPRGAAQLAVVHGGETILPTHQFGGGGVATGTVINISVSSLDPAGAATAVMRAIEEYEARNGTKFARAS